MNNITYSFGKRIRNIRQSKNISQEKLAELSGLHPTYIGQIERAEKSPTLESIYKIAEGLDLTISNLFDNIDENEKNTKTHYANKVYNEVISLSDSKKEKIYKIICDIINFD